MEKNKREILALCLLAVLGLAVASGMAWYLLIGHNWNKAATHIDDLVGSMEGYAVVLFEGNGELLEAVANEQVESTAGSSLGSDPSEDDPQAGEGVFRVNLDEEAANYREKGACVVRIRLDDLGRYADPMVVWKGGIRFGVCSSLGAYRYVAVRDDVRALKRAGAEFVIVVSDDASIEKGWLRDVDLVVLACDGHIPESGEYISSAFFVDAQYRGQARAVIVAPSGTMTAKTLQGQKAGS